MNDQTRTEFRVAGVDGWATDIMHEALKRQAEEPRVLSSANGKDIEPRRRPLDELIVPLESKMNSMLHNQARLLREDAIANASRTADILVEQIAAAKQGRVTIGLGHGDSVIAHPAFTAEADTRLTKAVIAELEQDLADALWVLEVLETSSVDLRIRLEAADHVQDKAEPARPLVETAR